MGNFTAGVVEASRWRERIASEVERSVVRLIVIGVRRYGTFSAAAVDEDSMRR